MLRPVLLGAALTPVQSKPSITIVGANGALGVNAMTKLCEPPAAIDTGAFGEPVSALKVIPAGMPPAVVTHIR